MGHPSGAASGKFAPVEGDFGDKEIEGGEEGQSEGETGLGHIEVGGQEIEEAGEDEVEGEDIGANHPLAVDLDLAVASGEERDQGAEEPKDGGDSVGEEEEGAPVVLQDEGSGSRDGDGDDVDAAHDAVPFKVSLAEARGEEEGSEDGCEDSCDDVWDEEDDVLDELGAVVTGLIEKRKIRENENGNSCESECSPKQGLGYVSRGTGTLKSCGHGLEICLGLRRLFGSLISSVVILFKISTH